MTTVFYVGIRPERDAYLNTNFFVEQDGKVYAGEGVDIQNFKPGPVTKGTKIDGLFQLNEKINVLRPFVIRDSGSFSLLFELSPEARQLMGK